MNDHAATAVPKTDQKTYRCTNVDCSLFGELAPFDVGFQFGKPFCSQCGDEATDIEARRASEVSALLERHGVDPQTVQSPANGNGAELVSHSNEVTDSSLAAEQVPTAETTGSHTASADEGFDPDLPISATQEALLALYRDTVDVKTECRKLLQVEPEELTRGQAKDLLRYLHTLAPEALEIEPIGHHGGSVESEQAKLASEKRAEAETNTETAARSVHDNLTPEFGKVLAKYEPGALAYGFPPAVGALIEKAKLTPEQTEHLLSNFRDLFSQLDSWRQKVDAIVIVDENDTEGIAAAKEISKAMASERLNADKKKKIIAEPYLRPKQLIDGVFKIYLDEETSIEKIAIQKAKTKELAEAARKDKIRQEREVKLATYVENPKAFDLLNMTEEAFEVLLQGQKEAFEARVAEQERLEVERQRKEDEAAADRVKIRRQNERTQTLSSLGFVRDPENKRYILEDITIYDNDIEGENDVTWLARVEDLKPKAEAIRAEQARKRSEAEKAIKDQQERERLEKSEEYRKQREAEAVALAPDKIKLTRLADAIAAIDIFETSNEKIIDILSGVKGDLFGVVTKLRRQIEQLP